MEWILLSLLAAFGQAFGWALKKKALVTQGINNTLGAGSFLIAGGALFLFWLTLGRVWPDITQSRIIVPLGVMIGGNILAVWSAYRALDSGSFSRLMPLMALTALFIVPIEYILKGVVPTEIQVVGIGFIIVGAVFFTSVKNTFKNDTLLATYIYFGVTLLVYSCMPVFQSLVVDATRDGLFAAAIIHVGIGLGFLPLILLSDERATWKALASNNSWTRVLWFIVVSGLVIGFLENGPATVALEYAHASEVFALKRTMPFFALLFGAYWFHEEIRMRHILSTALLIVGSVIVVLFR